MVGLFQDLLENGRFFLINSGRAGLRGLYSLLGNISFWRILTGIAVLAALFAWGRYLRFKGQLSIRKLKRLNRLRKSEESLARSGLILNPSLSGSLTNRGKREALVDLAEIVGPLREHMRALKENTLTDTKVYNAIFKKSLVLQKEFANRVHPVALTGIGISTDPLSKEYDEAINQLLKEREKEKIGEKMKKILKRMFRRIPQIPKRKKVRTIAPSEAGGESKSAAAGS